VVGTNSALLLRPDLSDPAVSQNVQQVINTSDLVTINFLLQSSLEQEITRLRPDLPSGKFFYFHELWYMEKHATHKRRIVIL